MSLRVHRPGTPHPPEGRADMATLVATPATRFDATQGSARPARWGAVYAMALCSFVLVASEFLPVSLLSPIAETLRLTEGQAGQAIAISGVFAVVTSLSFSVLLGRIDRRRVVLALIAMLIVSGAMVALAPSYLVFHDGACAARCRDRRVLVDVGGDRDPAGARGIGR